MTTAWLFPGQGSQYPGMGRDLFQSYEVADQIINEAEEISGLSLNDVRQRGPMHAITRVDVIEPLIAAVSIAYAQVMIDAGIKPDFVAGYSAGEVAALFAAGVLSRRDALRVATIRGRTLTTAMDPNVRMIAVSRISRELAAKTIDQMQPQGTIEIAAWNAPDHVTVVGADELVRVAEGHFVREGAEIAEVPVSGMWHSQTLSGVAQQIESELADVEFRSPKIPILTSAQGVLVQDSAQLRRDLARQIALPVQWQSIVEALKHHCVNNFVEVGASRTLFGLMRRNWPEATQYTAASVEGRSGNIKPLKRMLSEV